MYKVSLASTEWSIASFNRKTEDDSIKTSGFLLFLSDCVDHAKIMVSDKHICHFHYLLLYKAVVES